VTALLLASVVALVAVNGFFVGAEFALVRARRARIDALERQGARGAALASQQIDRIDSYLAACQLGITMASLGIGFLGEPAIARLLEEPLGEVVSHGVAAAIAIAIAYLIVTAAHITVGEQVPKIWSIAHADSAVRWFARPLQWFFVASKPLTYVLNTLSNAMLRLIGTDPRAELEEGTSGEDLRLLIAESSTTGTLARREAEMLSGVFNLRQAVARQVMTPFHAVVSVDATATAREAIQRCLDSGHTRLVVVEADRPDQVAGVAHTNSLSRLLLAGRADAPVVDAVKPALIVPETKSLDDLLADLQRDRTTLAVVADEYGTPVGIVTVEDIVEEIVGEIADETDPVVAPVRRLANGDWYARGDVSLDDLLDYGVVLPPSPDYTSVGGLVMDELGRLPAIGEIVEKDGYSLRVESVRGTRIEAVRIRDHEPGRLREPAA
jgi:CBS domain containing-hemolysin-like protein